MRGKKNKTEKKSRLHPRNQHLDRYDLDKLIESCPELANFIIENRHGDPTIDFFQPEAVKLLNKALLLEYYDLEYWDIPEGYLCPPIPGRADYIHHISDLIRTQNFGNILKGSKIKCLDIGTGANCVYPIIGSFEYGWSFVGTDIDEKAIDSANKIISSNPRLVDHVECRLQKNPKNTLTDIIQKDERFDIVICNPPFHASQEEAEAGTLRKLSNLKKEKVTKKTLNFGGNANELWTEGGEKQFILDFIRESKKFQKSCYCFSTLVSKEANLKYFYELLDSLNVTMDDTIPMGQGNKTSRILTWTFLSEEHEKQWKKERWSDSK